MYLERILSTSKILILDIHCLQIHLFYTFNRKRFTIAFFHISAIITLFLSNTDFRMNPPSPSHNIQFYHPVRKGSVNKSRKRSEELEALGQHCFEITRCFVLSRDNLDRFPLTVNLHMSSPKAFYKFVHNKTSLLINTS